MKKILLLRPVSKLPKTLPVGLLYLSTYIKKKLNGDVQVNILDLRLRDNFVPDIIERRSLNFRQTSLEFHV